MIASLWILVFSFLLRITNGYEELVEVTGCDTCRLMLTCRHLTAVIAILKVDFAGHHLNDIFETGTVENWTGNGSFMSVIAPPLFPPVHPRDVLNARCSGLNHCSFILSEDCPGSEIFGPGNVTIQYACITEDRIQKYCNSDIRLTELYAKGLSEGYIHNPGYPRFYSGQRQCKWRIIGQEKQKIKVTILDISLIVDRPNCIDRLEIRDTGQVIFSTCKQTHPPTEVISGTESIEIVLSSTQSINPRRGFLLHFAAVGCPEIELPQDSYLMYRNAGLMVFSCCLGYQFPDTGTRIKSVGCQGAFWNSSLPLLHCQKSTTPYWNQTKDLIRVNPVKIEEMASDLIAPAVVVVGLFVINAAVLFLIRRARKRQDLTNINDEELGSFTLSSPVE
ncbi:uncharacterized protein [Diabrotica undecimpunctata]|uniref:uncharacterized protein n=1 Tax=Diabrotica undecimpunctata TaxID=50387 RepID=UPI003B63DACA